MCVSPHGGSGYEYESYASLGSHQTLDLIENVCLTYLLTALFGEETQFDLKKTIGNSTVLGKKLRTLIKAFFYNIITQELLAHYMFPCVKRSIYSILLSEFYKKLLQFFFKVC